MLEINTANTTNLLLKYHKYSLFSFLLSESCARSMGFLEQCAEFFSFRLKRSFRPSHAKLFGSMSTGFGTKGLAARAARLPGRPLKTRMLEAYDLVESIQFIGCSISIDVLHYVFCCVPMSSCETGCDFDVVILSVARLPALAKCI